MTCEALTNNIYYLFCNISYYYSILFIAELCKLGLDNCLFEFSATISLKWSNDEQFKFKLELQEKK